MSTRRRLTGGVGPDGYGFAMAAPTTTVAYGEVFTRRWVVDLILDLCGYTPDRDLTGVRVAEPAVGGGAFWGPVLERLISSRATNHPDQPWAELGDALRGWDVQQQHIVSCRKLTVGLLTVAGCPAGTAEALATRWLRTADFLLAGARWEFTADLVVGNPPYIRIEDLDPALLAAYRAACPTMGGRADVFIGFIEHAMDMLAPGGRVGFICADRWMRNQYGQRLREKILRQGFAIDVALTMHDADAFVEPVSAYPAVTVLRAGRQGPAVVGRASAYFNAPAAGRFAGWAASNSDLLVDDHVTGHRMPGWHQTADSWAEGSPAAAAWLADLESQFGPLENPATGTRIGIGIATGRDAVFIAVPPHMPDVEPERLLPLARAADIKSGTFNWSGAVLVNPWTAAGLILDLATFPRLGAYLRAHEEVLRGRNVGRRNPHGWWRTIDRVNHSLLDQPYLAMADMTAQADPVLVPAGHYPHHNLYVVTSTGWDLQVLGGILLSKVVERQVAAYCVKMRGGTLRFQAQYLRRVRVPHPDSILPGVQALLAAAFQARDREAATRAALAAYELDSIPD